MRVIAGRVTKAAQLTTIEEFVGCECQIKTREGRRIEVVAYGRLAEICAQLLTVGRSVVLVGDGGEFNFEARLVQLCDASESLGGRASDPARPVTERTSKGYRGRRGKSRP